MEPLFADLTFLLGGRVGGIPHGLAVHLDHTRVRPFQKVQAAQQSCFAGTGRADDRQRFPLLQIQGDVLQHMGLAKIFPDTGSFEQRHNLSASLAAEIIELFFSPVEQDGQCAHKHQEEERGGE